MNEVLTNGSHPSPPPTISSSASRSIASALVLPNASINSEIRCFCGYDQDDGFTIQCDKCSHWQHSICVKINQKSVPDTFICYYCETRDLQITDIERATDIQRKRFEVEERKPMTQPKRTTGASHRKPRETNGHARTQSETISQKLQSPKEVASGKPRGRQRPISAQPHTSLPDTSASPDEHSPTGKSPSIERDLVSDSEVPPSVYTKEYSPIQDNTFVSPEVDQRIRTWAYETADHGKSTIVTPESPTPCTPRRYSKTEFHDLIPSGHTVRWVSLPEETSALGLPLIRLVADAPSKADQFVIEYVGEIGSKTSYIQDTYNQYQRIRHPKAFVLFHPQLPIYIDARRCGSEARFVRRSCRPNLKFETMVVNSTDLKFSLYTNRVIDKGTELTIGWEWDSSLPFSRLLDDTASEEVDLEDLQRMKKWAEVVTSTVGECACADQETCLMARLRGDVTVGKPKKSAKPGTKRRWKEMQDSNAVGREVSPEKYDSEKYKRRSSSTSSHRKSESRDRTPTFPSADISQSSVITDRNPSARELRKVQETINLINKLTNPDASHNRKRVKRPSTGPLSGHILPNGTMDLPEKTKLASENTTPTPTTNGQVTMLPDSIQSNQSSPTMTNGISPVRTSPKASYVDGGVQTESEVSRAITNTMVPASRKMRILAQFRAQNQQREKSLKPELSIVKEESPLKEIKTEPDQDIMMTDIDPSTHPVGLKPTNLETKDPLDRRLLERDQASEVGTNGLQGSSPSAIPFPNATTTLALQDGVELAFSASSGSGPPPLSPPLPQTPGLIIPSATASINSPQTTPLPRKTMSLSAYTAYKRKEKPESSKSSSGADTEMESASPTIPTAMESSAMDVDPPSLAASMGGAKS